MGQESGTWLTIMEESHKAIGNNVLPTPREKKSTFKRLTNVTLGEKKT